MIESVYKYIVQIKILMEIGENSEILQIEI